MPNTENTTLVVQECEFWFVWTKTGHIPRRCHNTQAEAEAEADRLARLIPHGKKYIVLRAYRKSHVPSDGTGLSPLVAAGASVHSMEAA